MTKIGKLHGFLCLCMFSLLWNSSALAQGIHVSASLSETTIFSGEQVKLDLTISGTSMGSVDEPGLPQIDGLRWLRGSTSRGTKYSLINGSPSVSYSFGYILIAQQPGTYTLPAIKVSVDNKTYSSNPISFKVLDPATIDKDKSERAPEIYIRLEPTTKSPYVGQQVIVNVVLYFKKGVEVSSYQPTPGWKAEGFWKEELEYPQRAQTSSTIINGVRYQRAKLIQYALFPTKSGELTLSPFEITVSVRKQRTSNDFFGFGVNQERMSLQSIPVTLNVQSLPELKNADFIGAVGDFKISRSISPKSALVGESIEITTVVKGTGNVPLINKPEYTLPASLETYNPQENSSITRTNQRISGTRTFTDIVIARNEGQFVIPAKKVAFFNPQKKRYVIKKLPELDFEAKRDPNAIIATTDDLRLNVKPITGLAQWTYATSSSLHQKTWVWVLIFLPLIITGAVYGYKKYDERMNTDTAFARSRTANDSANKTLTEAEHTNDVKNGYYLIEKAIVQYLTDKLNLPPAGLSHSDIIEEVEQKTEPELTKELKRLLNKCETIAYAPNATQETLHSDIERTRALIKKLGKLS